MRSNLIRACVAAACAWLASGAAGAEKESLEKVVPEAKVAIKEIFAGRTDVFWPHYEKQLDAGKVPPSLIQELYNSGKREMALRLLAASPQEDDPYSETKSLRMKIARYELDFETLEAMYRAEIDAAIAAKKPVSDEILKDTVMAERVLPEYFDQMEKLKSPGLFELLRKGYAKRPQLLEIYHAQLRVQPGELQVLRDYVSACKSIEAWDELLGEATLPKGAAELPDYWQAKAEALAAVGKRKEALAWMAEMESRFPQQEYPFWKPLCELYLKLGEKEKAAAAARKWGRRWCQDEAEILGQAGDKAGVAECARDALAGRNNAAPTLMIAHACWAVGENELAEQLFDRVEERELKSVERSQSPLFEFSYEVRYFYEKHGRLARLFEKLLPLAGKLEDDRFSKFMEQFPWRELAAQGQAEAMKQVFEKNSAAFGKRWPFVMGHAMGLSAIGEYEHAIKKCDEALKMIASLEVKPTGSSDLYLRGEKEKCRLQLAKKIAAAAPPNPPAAIVPPPAIALPAATVAPAPPVDVVKPAVLFAARRRVETEPNNAVARSSYAVMLLQLGRVDEGRAEVRRCVELGLFSKPHFQWLESCMVFMNEESMAMPSLIVAYGSAGALDKLEEDFAPAMKTSKRIEAEVLRMQAQQYRAAGKLKEAIVCHERVAAIDPWNASAHAAEIRSLREKLGGN